MQCGALLGRDENSNLFLGIARWITYLDIKCKPSSSLPCSLSLYPVSTGFVSPQLRKEEKLDTYELTCSWARRIDSCLPSLP